MPPVGLHSWVLLARPYVCSACRRVGSEGLKLPAFRALHNSPTLHRPRKREFFSSSSPLHSQKLQNLEPLRDDAHDAIQPDNPKRKTARSPAAKTSLRRVAVEAQRSKDGGLLVKSNLTSDRAPAPRLVTAYAVAEQFDLAKVVEILRSKGYEPDPLGTGLYPQVVHVQVPVSSIHRSIYQRPLEVAPGPKTEDQEQVPGSDSADARQGIVEVGDIFIFPSGTLVTWALPEGFTSFFATRTLLPAAEQPHVNSLETEDLDYIEDPSREHSVIRGDTIILGTKPTMSASIQSDESQAMDAVLTKIAFSSGFARSTKLAVLETSLSSYLTSTAQIPTLLSRGSRLPLSISRSFILRKTGELLSLRAQLNLYSELTDSLPDLFWDSRHELGLEGYYDQVGRALDVGIRIKVLNEKMDYAQEIATVLRERLSEKHGYFLEWTIIVLIAIEVSFEILRLWREGFWDEVWSSRKFQKTSVAN
jgi:required for meiotic nuclear division protein 1